MIGGQTYSSISVSISVDMIQCHALYAVGSEII